MESTGRKTILVFLEAGTFTKWNCSSAFWKAEIYFSSPLFSSQDIRRVSKPATLTERLSTLAWYPLNTGFFFNLVEQCRFTHGTLNYFSSPLILSSLVFQYLNKNQPTISTYSIFPNCYR